MNNIFWLGICAILIGVALTFYGWKTRFTMTGEIAEVAIWDRALTEKEIKTIQEPREKDDAYDGIWVGVPLGEGLIGYWRASTDDEDE